MYMQEDYKCQHCMRSYKTERALKIHQTKMHLQKFVDDKNDNDDVTLLRHMCEYCGYRTRLKANLNVHKRRHTGEKPFCCETCGKCFPASYQLVTHSEIHRDDKRRRNQHRCSICGVGFLSSRALYHHKPLHAASKKYICKLCPKAYAQSSGYAQHKRWHRALNGRATNQIQLDDDDYDDDYDDDDDEQKVNKHPVEESKSPEHL